MATRFSDRFWRLFGAGVVVLESTSFVVINGCPLTRTLNCRFCPLKCIRIALLRKSQRLKLSDKHSPKSMSFDVRSQSRTFVLFHFYPPPFWFSNSNITHSKQRGFRTTPPPKFRDCHLLPSEVKDFRGSIRATGEVRTPEVWKGASVGHL